MTGAGAGAVIVDWWELCKWREVYPAEAREWADANPEAVFYMFINAVIPKHAEAVFKAYKHAGSRKTFARHFRELVGDWLVAERAIDKKPFKEYIKDIEKEYQL